ncbi:hypothetical protein KIH87_01920 [Paraneptunicella aestuarii]|uniref:hypothetical protein n=1 Tax=Paraneptunicella aestuarii TaxID=2831148 RepID=UPI001E3B8EAC|nr:hypothetical protein [Paraneptunicella aestuarii]UAA39147.1 hypothetical protein KIH87_01920 [Paraneptunicella aestuarii]
MPKLISRQLNTLLHKLLAQSIAFNLLHMLYHYVKIKVWGRQSIEPVGKFTQSGHKRKLAIIGCGPSVNDLDDDFFEQLGDYDVAAFSYAALLPVNIEFYFYELPRGTLLRQHQQFLYPELVKKQEKGMLRHFILKNTNAKGKQLLEPFSELKLSITFPIHLRSTRKLAQLLDILDFFKLTSRYFFQPRASLFSICHWADAMGYEEILLVGIDLNSSKYFYEENSKWLTVKIPNPFSDEELSSGVHPVNDEKIGIKLTDAMLVLSKRLKAKVYLTNPESALASMFECKNENRKA